MGGVECEITEEPQEDSIKCLTPPQHISSDGFYPGSRGMIRNRYNDLTNDTYNAQGKQA